MYSESEASGSGRHNYQRITLSADEDTVKWSLAKVEVKNERN